MRSPFSFSDTAETRLCRHADTEPAKALARGARVRLAPGHAMLKDLDEKGFSRFANHRERERKREREREREGGGERGGRHARSAVIDRPRANDDAAPKIVGAPVAA